MAWIEGWEKVLQSFPVQQVQFGISEAFIKKVLRDDSSFPDFYFDHFPQAAVVAGVLHASIVEGGKIMWLENWVDLLVSIIYWFW